MKNLGFASNPVSTFKFLAIENGNTISIKKTAKKMEFPPMLTGAKFASVKNGTLKFKMVEAQGSIEWDNDSIHWVKNGNNLYLTDAYGQTATYENGTLTNVHYGLDLDQIESLNNKWISLHQSLDLAVAQAHALSLSDLYDQYYFIKDTDLFNACCDDVEGFVEIAHNIQDLTTLLGEVFSQYLDLTKEVAN